MAIEFEWDVAKDESNQRKHGLGFDEARQLFSFGADYLELFDEFHSGDEERFIAIGAIEPGIIAVGWTERIEGTIRIITARFATRAEVESYRRYMEDER